MEIFRKPYETGLKLLLSFTIKKKITGLEHDFRRPLFFYPLGFKLPLQYCPRLPPLPLLSLFKSLNQENTRIASDRYIWQKLNLTDTEM